MEVDILINRARRKIALKKKEEQKQLIQGEIGKVDTKVSEVSKEVNHALEVATEALEVAEKTSKQEGKKGEKGERGERGIDGKNGKDGKDGKDGINGRDGKDGKRGERGLAGKDGIDGKNGKDGKDGKDGSPDTPYEIRDKLSSLKGRERLDAKAIKNLNKEISLVVSGISAPSTGGTGGVTAHSELTELDYDSSGHTGFQPAGSYLTEETDPVFTAWDKDYADLTNKPTIPEDVSDLTDTGNVYVDTDGDTMTGDLIGTDFVSTRGFTITRVGGYISQIAKTDGRTIDYTRDVNDYIESVTDGTRTWTLTRDVNNYITGCVVT